MARLLLALGALSAVGIGCRDGPTAVDEASKAFDSPPTILISAEARAAVRELLDDPFVRELVAVADAGLSTKPMHGIMRTAMDGVTGGEPQQLVHALRNAQLELSSDREKDDEIEREVLRLILDDVQAVLDGDSQLGAVEEKGVSIRDKEGRSRR